MAQWTPEQIKAMSEMLMGTHRSLGRQVEPGMMGRGQPMGEERLSPGWPWQPGSETALAAIDGVSPQQWEAQGQSPRALPPPVMAYQKATSPRAVAAPQQSRPLALPPPIPEPRLSSAQRYAATNQAARDRARANASSPSKSSASFREWAFGDPNM